MPSTQGKIFQFIQLFFVTSFIFLVGCSDFNPVEKKSPVKDEFIVLVEDRRVLYKSGLKEQALLIQDVLDKQIELIEKVHGKPFVNPPIVHLCDTRECFAEYTGINSGILAAVSSNGLFLKSYVITNDDYSSWLAHELSHLHLRQQISTFKASFIPQWYQEGLATFASSGGGANKISREKAIDYFEQGKHFIANEKASLFSQAWTSNYTAAANEWPKPWYQQHMNYRQASLFYEYLHPNGGVELLRAIERGEKFYEAFTTIYGKAPQVMLELYRAEITR